MRQLSPAAFALAIVLFFLPWVAISCDAEGRHQQLCELRGIDMSLGLRGCGEELRQQLGAREAPGLDLRSRGRSTDVKAQLALLAAVVGLGTSLLLKDARQRSMAGAVCGFLGGLFVLLLQQLGGGEVPGLTVDYKIGYWLALATFVAAGVLSLKAREAATAAPPRAPGG